MASLALMAVGNALFPAAAGSIAWGATIGGLAGSYLDQAYIMPALFPVEQQDFSVGKLDDLKIESASEGTPINRCYGAATPCFGTIIWKSKLIEVATTEDAGGKGGGGGGAEYTTYTYYIDVAVGVCNGPRDISRIWADGKLIYSTSGTDVTLYNITGNIYILKIGSQTIMDIVYNSSGVLPDFDIGREVGLSGTGFYEVNSGSFELVAMFLDDSDLTHLRFVNAAGQEQELGGYGYNIITQSAEVVTGQYDSLTIYYGDDTNVPDPIIESYKGTGNVPAYNGRCYVVFHRLKLTDYGNRPPNLKFLVVGEVIGSS
jgi:hypothetical protein